MADLDFSRWAIVSPKDDTGFGRQATMLKRAFHIRRHIAVPSDRLDNLPPVAPQETFLAPEEPFARVEEELSGLQGIIFFERCDWHPMLLAVAQKLGVKTVCVANWEWFTGWKPTWCDVDLIVCPSEWTFSVVRSYGHMHAVHLTWPVDIAHLPERRITGPARLFVHNAGLVDVQDRKGTRDTIVAFRKVSNRDIRLLVRLQREAELPKGDDRIEVRIGNLSNNADLYLEGDVAIQPSKMEGVGFMVIEPHCCGIPVITTDYPPMNEYVRDPRLLVKPRWGKRKAFPTAWVKHAHLRLPKIGDLCRKIEWCAENDLTEMSAASRRDAMVLYDPERVHVEWTRALEALLPSDPSSRRTPS